MGEWIMGTLLGIMKLYGGYSRDLLPHEATTGARVNLNWSVHVLLSSQPKTLNPKPCHGRVRLPSCLLANLALC